MTTAGAGVKEGKLERMMKLLEKNNKKGKKRT